MGASGRDATDHVMDNAQVDFPKLTNVHDYNFYQLVELLQKLHQLNPEDEEWERQCKLVFSANTSLGFSPSDVEKVTHRDDERMVMLTNFFGLSGAQSPLPGFIVEQLVNEDPGGMKQPFFDFFNNRLINLVHRIWRKYRYFVRFQPNAEDEFSAQLLSLVGLGLPELRGDTPINWCKMLAYSGTLAGRSRSPQVVAGIIAHCFDLDHVEIRQWTPRTVKIERSQQTSIGVLNSALGSTSIIGESVVDCNSKFTICIGNLSHSKFSDFLPSGKEFSPLCKLIEVVLREQMAYDLELTMNRCDAPDFRLGMSGEGALGWTSFLNGQTQEHNVLIQVRQ
ncbi:type VI secretion system baseplate subunit TssG [Vibrio aquaticus]|uniref:Type VI secretion system baseplate subunit TssG n=1 Tax=Vibrio aquaticus TaxID=2496559 RepID=A0A432CYT3_9VIBR|nr:type VI secretion system baseplate subunit TssG [Vibrio aquaticus]RTZ16411.1 type VI secretion system baseplate subunit TssG [Vibrio aquaticus]